MSKLPEREQNTVSWYDAHGEEWDTAHALYSMEQYLPPEIETLQGYMVGTRILDIGCGSGHFAETFMDRGLEYTGLDPSETMLRLAKERNPDGTFVEADVYEMPFANQSFDAFWCSNVLLHVPKARLDEALQEIRRVMHSPSVGCIITKGGSGEGVGEEGRFWSLYSAEEFAGYLFRNGYSILDSSQRRGSNSDTLMSFFVRL